MIDSLLDEMENHYANLQACRLKPHVLAGFGRGVEEWYD